MMPEDGLAQIRDHDAIFLGAVGFPGVPDHVSLWGLLIPIRREFQQYVNLRPVRLMPGVPSPLANRKPGDIDFWVVRENNEGEYSSMGGRMYAGTEHEFATQLSVFTRARHRPHHALRLRAREDAQEEARDLGDEVQRHRDHDAVLGRALQGDLGEVSRT